MSNESDNELYIAFEHGAESRESEIESLRQQLAGANARIELMGETALNQQKREVMLRDALRIANGVLVDNYDLRIPVVTEALDDTADLDGLILCHAEPVGWIGTGPRDGRSEFSESKPANSVMRDFNMKPLYRAWEPK